MPNGTHARVWRWTTARVAKRAAPVHATGSTQFIDRMWHMPSISGATATHTAASPCANRPPPSVRAISPVSHTEVAASTAGSKRSALTESPSSTPDRRAMTATSGG